MAKNIIQTNASYQNDSYSSIGMSNKHKSQSESHKLIANTECSKKSDAKTHTEPSIQTNIKPNTKLSSQHCIQLTPIGAVVCHAITRLIAGQRQFACEFGLAAERVFPESYKYINCNENQLRQNIAVWLATQEGEGHLIKLFDEIIEHQIGLFHALDGIVCETLWQCVRQQTGFDRIYNYFAKHLKLIATKQKINDYHQNQHLRYQHIIAPALIDSYCRYREGKINHVRPDV